MIDTAATPKFPMGQIVATPMALEVIKEGNQTPDQFLWRHLHGDWGTLCDDDVPKSVKCQYPWNFGTASSKFQGFSYGDTCKLSRLIDSLHFS